MLRKMFAVMSLAVCVSTNAQEAGTAARKDDQSNLLANAKKLSGIVKKYDVVRRDGLRQMAETFQGENKNAFFARQETKYLDADGLDAIVEGMDKALKADKSSTALDYAFMLDRITRDLKGDLLAIAASGDKIKLKDVKVDELQMTYLLLEAGLFNLRYDLQQYQGKLKITH